MCDVTILEAVQEEAKALGVEVTDDLAEHIVWSQTGYPCFWPDAAKTPEENFRTQLREALGKLKRGEPLHDGPSP